jgi:L-rhamnose mutarotase
MVRMAAVIRLRPEKAREYEELHAAVWPDVLTMIAACHIRNYTIFLHRPEMLLFATFEYHGTDWVADTARMKADPATQRWWKLTDPCQEPLPSRGEGEWWASMAEIFHTD